MVKPTETLFPCDQCPFKAKEKGSLSLHLKSVHEGVKYPCDQCSFKATWKVNLLQHTQSIHTG